MPAEWSRHDRCWMAWPCREALWGDELPAAREAFAAVAKAIAAFEPVTMIAPHGLVEEAARLCGRAVDVATPRRGDARAGIDDSWMRDTGPSFLIDGKGGIAGCDWRFNGWGGKYTSIDDDAALASRILAQLNIKCFSAPFVLEGGAIHVDGGGTALVTESVLLNANRNPAMDKAAMERHLAEWIGARKVIWLPGGLVGDETDGHVDNVACFARPGVVLALKAAGVDDPNDEILHANRRILEDERDANGRRLEVIEIEQPTLRDGANRPLAASYINFYLANGGVIAPRFGIPADGPAADALADTFPERRVVQVDASAIVRGGGGIHCITQQQPRP
ncbi:MAG: agmatine deiminase family protein [Alphaproteobacteria bacterium]|nr:agmatine deiminase family protein [Alphaproteobacteria bacterium]